MFNILREILKSHTFMMYEVSKRRVTNGTESNALNLFLQIRGIVE